MTKGIEQIGEGRRGEKKGEKKFNFRRVKLALPRFLCKNL